MVSQERFITLQSVLLNATPKNCPVKFGFTVNSEGIIIQVSCSSKESAWFFRIITRSSSSLKNYAKTTKKNNQKDKLMY